MGRRECATRNDSRFVGCGSYSDIEMRVYILYVCIHNIRQIGKCGSLGLASFIWRIVWNPSARCALRCAVLEMSSQNPSACLPGGVGALRRPSRPAPPSPPLSHQTQSIYRPALPSPRAHAVCSPHSAPSHPSPRPPTNQPPSAKVCAIERRAFRLWRCCHLRIL